MSDQPKPTTGEQEWPFDKNGLLKPTGAATTAMPGFLTPTGEWTAETVMLLSQASSAPFLTIADAHNSALAKERKQGHSALRMKDGKLETFDPHPPWKWERGAMLPQSIEELELVVNAALAAKDQEIASDNLQLAAERDYGNRLTVQLDEAQQQLAAERERTEHWKQYEKLARDQTDRWMDANQKLRQELAAALKRGDEAFELSLRNAAKWKDALEANRQTERLLAAAQAEMKYHAKKCGILAIAPLSGDTAALDAAIVYAIEKDRTKP